MRIKTVSVLSSLVLIALAGCIVVVVLLTGAQTNAIARQGLLAEQIIKRVFDLNTFAQSYVSFPEDRPREQWNKAYAQLIQILDSPALREEPSRSVIDEIGSQIRDIRVTFDRLVFESTISPDGSEAKKLLAGDLLVKTQQIINLADTLAQKTTTDREAARSFADRLLFSLVAGLTVAMIFSFLILYRKIIGPIVKLQKGVEVIGKGNLAYKVGRSSDDEIGRLSREFDTMTGRLKLSYDNLEAKVRQRTAELADLNRKNEILLESIGDGVVAIDKNWKIILWNPAATHLTGWSREEAMGKSFKEIVRFVKKYGHTENTEFIGEAMSSATSRNMAGDTLLIRKDGVELPVGDSAAPILSDTKEVTGAIIVFRDTSKE